nr:linear amide C-N hydrolase [Gammaproteobacteria bacterium]
MFLLRAMMLVLTLLCATEVYPCTNILYKYKDQYLVGRNFDWLNNDTDVVFNPIGKKRETAQLAKNEKPLIWRSQYGSVTFVMTTPKGKLIPTAVQGGMNQKGLVVSLLEFSKAKFQKPSKTIPNINNTYLTQYWLDTCQSVAQAIKALNHLNVVTTWWYGNAVPIHYVLRDAKGNSAVVEYIDGKKHVFEGKSLPFRVL